MTVFEKIAELQKGKENTAPWMVGEQLKDICRREPQLETVVLEDLENPDMSLEKCEQQIKAWADKQKRTGNCVCVAPNVAEGIIRKFYGLGEGAAKKEEGTSDPGQMLNLEDLLGDL